MPILGSPSQTALAAFLRGVHKHIPEKPKAVLLISAHWEVRQQRSNRQMRRRHFTAISRNIHRAVGLFSKSSNRSTHCLRLVHPLSVGRDKLNLYRGFDGSSPLLAFRLFGASGRA